MRSSIHEIHLYLLPLILCAVVVNPTNADETAILVYPNSVTTTRDYPANVAVFETLANGTVRMVEADEANYQSDDPQIASTNKAILQFAAAGQTKLNVAVGAKHQSMDVNAVSDAPLTFNREVAAVLSKAGCNLGTCHGNLHGKGGFRLSLRGDDPTFDFDRITSEYGGRRIDLFDPAESLLVKKATAQIAHQGKQRFDVNSPEYDRLVRWLASGATQEPSSPLKSIEAFPRDVRIAFPNRRSRVIVIATFEDGTTRDVTRWSRFEPSLPTGVFVSSDGVIDADHALDVALNISYLTGRTAARVAFLGETKSQPQHPTTSGNPIDLLVQKQLDALGLSTAPLADDATFLRRAYLVVVGRLPTAEQAKSYFADTGDNKRERLVDQLLADPGFDLMWALRWGDLLRNEEKVMSPAGASKLHQWLSDQSANDRPINQMVADLIGETGSTYNNPPASFHRTHRDPFIAAESTAQVFLGVRVACAKCHNHPFDVWRQDDYYGLSAYFTTLKREQIDNKPKDEFDKHVITGDEIISLEEKPAEIRHPGISRMISARPLGTGAAAVVSTENQDASPLKRLAHWLTVDNAMFDRNIANRVWYQYFGKGIVDPPDDIRSSNPPSNPELLDFIASDLKAHNYSVRHLSRLILTSDAFARESASDVVAQDELPPASYFAGYPIHRLPAETLLDALSDATRVPTKFRGMNQDQEGTPPVTRAIAMPGVPRRAGFLTTFGKPNRLMSCECERTSQVSLGQSLAMLNGVEVRDKLIAKNNFIDDLRTRFVDDHQLVEEMYLAVLTRQPTQEERTALVEYLHSNSRGKIEGDKVLAGVLKSFIRWPIASGLLDKRQPINTDEQARRRAAEDIMWSLMNSKEFIMIR